MNHRKSEPAKEWGGHRRGKPAASQRAGVPLLKITRFEPKTILKCKLACKMYLKPK